MTQALRSPLLTSILAALMLAGAAATPGQAGETRVAVAANFTEAAREIGAAFAKATGHKAIFSFGSTGQLYAQIAKAAPFEVFLAADRARPQAALKAGLAVEGTRFTYATGRLALYSRDASAVRGPDILKTSSFNKIAIANPVTAPYGAAAVEALKKLGAYDTLKSKLVQGSNIAQTYQFVATGNAEIGFVALAQIVRHEAGSRWIVPENLHAPIAQDAILLKSGASNAAARAFLEFLKSPQAIAIVRKFGYGAGQP